MSCLRRLIGLNQVIYPTLSDKARIAWEIEGGYRRWFTIQDLNQRRARSLHRRFACQLSTIKALLSKQFLQQILNTSLTKHSDVFRKNAIADSGEQQSDTFEHFKGRVVRISSLRISKTVYFLKSNRSMWILGLIGTLVFSVMAVGAAVFLLLLLIGLFFLIVCLLKSAYRFLRELTE